MEDPGDALSPPLRYEGLSDKGEIIVSSLFEWDPKTDSWDMPNQSFYLKKAAVMKGITIDRLSPTSMRGPRCSPTW